MREGKAAVILTRDGGSDVIPPRFRWGCLPWSPGWRGCPTVLDIVHLSFSGASSTFLIWWSKLRCILCCFRFLPERAGHPACRSCPMTCLKPHGLKHKLIQPTLDARRRKTWHCIQQGTIFCSNIQMRSSKHAFPDNRLCTEISDISSIYWSNVMQLQGSGRCEYEPLQPYPARNDARARSMPSCTGRSPANGRVSLSRFRRQPATVADA